MDGGDNDTMNLNSADSTEVLSFQSFIVDSAFIDMFHIQITDDRHAGFDTHNYLVSQSAMKKLKQLGFTDHVHSSDGNYSWNITGEFKDFQVRSLLEKSLIRCACRLLLPTVSALGTFW